MGDQAGAIDRIGGLKANFCVFERLAIALCLGDRLTREGLGQQKANQKNYG